MTNENVSRITANNASTPNNPQVTGKIQRKTACIISWIAVVAMLALIFFMSSRSGIDIDNNTGIFSAVKQWLSAQAAALFGHEVDGGRERFYPYRYPARRSCIRIFGQFGGETSCR